MSAHGLTEAEVRLCEEIASRHDSMRRELMRYVSIPTGHNYTPGLDELRGLVTERLGALGAEARLIPGEPAPEWVWSGAKTTGDTPVPLRQEIPPSVVCARAAEGLPRALLASHLDTVFPRSDPFCAMSASADGKTATGPGVADMKGGIVIALTALEALESAGIPCSWSYFFNSDEERGSYHSAAALAALAPAFDVGLCTEPALPGGELAVERGGSGQFLIETRGRAAHVGRAFEQGVSAVTALAEALVKVSRAPDPAAGRILSVGPIEGGAAPNAVPDYAKAYGNVRYPSQEVAEEIRAMLTALATDGDAMPAVTVRLSFNRPAKPMTPDVERLAGLARTCAQSLGQTLVFARTGGVCDGNILQQAGLPTIDTLGVRGGGLHSSDEWIELSSLVERCQLLGVLLARIAAGALAG